MKSNGCQIKFQEPETSYDCILKLQISIQQELIQCYYIGNSKIMRSHKNIKYFLLFNKKIDIKTLN
jgi:hypothetical protein